MSIFVESLRRLYRQNMLTKEKLEEFVKSNVITYDDLEYVMG